MRSTLNPVQWSRVREIYADALDHPREGRAALVVRLTGGDAELLSEVNSLLAAHEEARTFLDEPAVAALGLSAEAKATPELQQDTVLNKRFRIVRFVNRGGMGSVYEAWDSELEEMVALKTILPDLASDRSVIHHFKEEVKQARRISHPNICRVYDLFCHEFSPGEHLWFLTMQFLEGQTLKQRIDEEGPFEPEEAISLVEQMVSGLAAAHELGVVHRDFKSANIMLVPGKKKALRAVVTDFGLAVRVMPGQSESHQGSGQGSPAYVAPEQWKQGIVGPAADQYSLGVVMCEMITGERPAHSGSSADKCFTVELPNDTRLKARWKAVIRRCMQGRPEDRFSAVSAILPVLDPSRQRRMIVRRVLTATCAALLVVGVFLGTTAMQRRPAIRNLKQLTPIMDLSTSPSLSRDGAMIAYASDRLGAGNSDIWVQHLPDGIPVRVTDDPSEDDEDPSLSPDGKTVVFTSTRGNGGIYLASTEGGPARLIAENGQNPRFSPDGRSVLFWRGDDHKIRASAHIYLADLAGAKTTELAPGFLDAREGIWNSDGRHILFKGCRGNQPPIPSCWDWWVTTIDGEDPLKTGAMALFAGRKLELTGELGGWYGERVLFPARFGNDVHLWELNISPRTSVVGAEPKELTPIDPREMIISASLADDDVLALTDLSAAIHIWHVEHGATPDSTKSQRVTQDAEMDVNPSVSANGRWLIFARSLSLNRQLWIRDMLSGKEKVFPASGLEKFSPVIDDAGSLVGYEVWQGGTSSVLMQRTREPLPTTACTGCRMPTGWFDGDKGLLLSDASLSRVNLYRTATGQVENILSKEGAYVAEATWSPSNEFLLFTVSNDRGGGRGFVAHFPRGARAPDSTWIPVTESSESIQKPRWSGDGKTIYYLSNRDKEWCLWSRPFDATTSPGTGHPLAIQHYHNHKFSPNGVSSRSFNLSVAGDSVYLNIAEMSGTIWTGRLTHDYWAHVAFLQTLFN